MLIFWLFVLCPLQDFNNDQEEINCKYLIFKNFFFNDITNNMGIDDFKLYLILM